MRTLCQLKIKCINTHGTQRLTSGKYFVVWGSIPLLRIPSMTSPIPHFTNVTGIVCLKNATLSPEYGSANPSLFTSQTVKDEEYTLCLFKYLCAFFKEMVGFFFLNEMGLYSWKKISFECSLFFQRTNLTTEPVQFISARYLLAYLSHWNIVFLSLHPVLP